MVQNCARIVAGPVQWMRLASLRALAITSLSTAHQWALVAVLYRLAMQNEKEVQAQGIPADKHDSPRNRRRLYN